MHDRCILGDLDDLSNQLVLENYMFGMVTEDDTFNDEFDAIVGLAYPEFAEPGVVPFFDGLMEAGIMGKNVFAFHMSMNNDDEESELMLGDWDESRFTGNLDWYDIVHRRFWSIALDDVLIGGESLGLCTSERNCLITPDSGTSMITFPSWAYSQFQSNYGGEVDCEEGWEYEQEEITFVIGGKNYSLPSHHWNEREKVSSSGGVCYSSITMLDVKY